MLLGKKTNCAKKFALKVGSAEDNYIFVSHWKFLLCSIDNKNSVNVFQNMQYLDDVLKEI